MISKGYKILDIFCRWLFSFSKFVIPMLWRDFPSELWAHSLKSCLSVQRPSHIVFPVFFLPRWKTSNSPSSRGCASLVESIWQMVLGTSWGLLITQCPRTLNGAGLPGAGWTGTTGSTHNCTVARQHWASLKERPCLPYSKNEAKAKKSPTRRKNSLRDGSAHRSPLYF